MAEVIELRVEKRQTTVREERVLVASAATQPYYTLNQSHLFEGFPLCLPSGVPSQPLTVRAGAERPLHYLCNLVDSENEQRTDKT